MTGEFTGFSQAGLDFLAELSTHDKAWFDEHRQTYRREVVEPTKAFVVAVGEGLATSFAPDIVARPKANGSISPINNDLRFSPDKAPYKDHLLLRFWEGENKKLAPTLMIRIAPDGVGFSTGAMLDDLERWRRLIDDEATGEPLAAAVEALHAGRDLHVAGDGYKRVPKPYSDDHPRAELLRHKMLQARWTEPLPSSVHTADFSDWCVARLSACADVHRWLVTNL